MSEALALVDKNGERWYEAELHRLQGECVLALFVNNQTEAEASCHQALAVARRQEAKSPELRAAMRLSRLWQQQDKRDAARELLAPIYGWCTEGFDTADLQAAKALLEGLGGDGERKKARKRKEIIPESPIYDTPAIRHVT